MERYSDRAIEIINDLHTERLDYDSKYTPLIDAANQLAAYESTNLAPCGSWAPRGFDYKRIAREAKREGEPLREEIMKLIEQDSNYRLFTERAKERRIQ